MRTKKVICLLVVTLLTLSVLAGCGNKAQTPTTSTPAKTDQTKKLKVAFVYGGSASDNGWYQGHDDARKATQKALDYVDSSFMENVKPGAQTEQVLRELCDNGTNVIVTPSTDFQPDVLKVAKDFPDVKFLIIAGDVTQAPNVESFICNTSQTWYILGQIAGKLTKTNQIGTTGAIVSPLGVSIQNAFLLGAQSVNPQVQHRIIYLNTYYDPAAERSVALSLADAGCDVLEQATNTPNHVQVAQEKGIFAMSQFQDMRQFGEKAFVSGDIIKWENYYISRIKAIHDGTFVPKIYEPDLIKDGIIDIAPFGPMVTDEMKAMVNATKEKMKTDPKFFWKGPIYDNAGNLKVKEGAQLTDEEIRHMDWWVKGTITSMKGK